MAINVGQNQGNAAFDALCRSLDQVAQDPQANGRGDASQSDSSVERARGLRQAQNGVERTAWLMSTTEWLSGDNPRGIVWAVNPLDISWNMAQRSVHSKNMIGTVLHVWPDNFRETFFDEFRITLNLQSGNIMPVWLGGGSAGIFGNFGPDKWAPSPGIANFYDFMQLVDAPKITNDGRANLVTIRYLSNLFPSLTLVGMFDSSGIRFSDTSSDPNQVVSWSADFIVYDTIPRLSDNSGKQLSNLTMLNQWMKHRVEGNKISSEKARQTGSGNGGATNTGSNPITTQSAGP